MSDDYITPGQVVDDRFAVGPTIGSGAFGIVYRAEDRTPEAFHPRLVALKTLRPKAFGMPDLVERFGREIQICSQLVHRNIAQLLHFGRVDVGRQRDVPYMVMELVRGLPLGGLVELRGTLTVEETAHILAHVLDGLDAAHLKGILHRDLKPNNILIACTEAKLGTPGDGKDLFSRVGIPGPEDATWHDLTALDVKVVDFGLGKMLETRGKRVKRLTRAGVAAGTAEYMSPEQVMAVDNIDQRADVYGVAMLMYRLLTGKPTYEGGSLFEVAHRQVNEPIPPLPDELADHPIHAVYQRAGAKERDDRYTTADEMAYHLRKAIDPDADLPQPRTSMPTAAKKRGFFSRLLGR